MRDFFNSRPAAMVALLIAVLLSIGGLAVAQEGVNEGGDDSVPTEVAQAEETTTAEGGEEAQDPATIGERLPPQAGSDGEVPAPLREGWTGGIPEWAGDEEGDGGPPFMRDEYDSGWRPGSGKPPWAGTGEGPPWAGQDGDE